MRNSFSTSLGTPFVKLSFNAASAASAVLLADAPLEVGLTFAEVFAALLAFPRTKRKLPEICVLQMPLEDKHDVRTESVSGRSIGGCVIIVELRKE